MTLTRFRAGILAAALALSAGPLFAVAQVATTVEIPWDTVKQVVWTWTSASDGTVVKPTDNYFTGSIIAVIFDPGTAAPTDNYDVTITDSNGLDVLNGFGADRDASVNDVILRCSLTAVVASKLTLNITNAGAVKSGTVTIQLQ